MDSTNTPARIQLPFANGGAKNTIPVPSQIGVTPGAASYTDGFPPATRTPISAGGIPPFGVDMNGILNAITAIDRWLSAGGMFKYDAAFATAVGGYPKGARLVNAAGTGIWLNMTENNTTDPDAGGAGWFNPFGNAGGIIPLNTTQTLTPYHAGVLIGITAASITLTLPARSLLADGSTFKFVNSAGPSAATIAPPAGDSFVAASAVTRSSLSIGPGDSVEITKFGSTWVITGGSLQLGVLGSNAFGAQLAVSGYQRLPTGRIEVQGTFVSAGTAGNPVAVNFPITATNGRNLVLTPVSNGVGPVSAWFDTLTGTGFNGRCSNIATTVHYRAIID